MTKARKRPTGYMRFLVEPAENFSPTNWQQTPSSYRIIEFAGTVAMLGQADSWKFLHNHAAIRNGGTCNWAIHVPLGKAEEVEQLKRMSAERALAAS